MTDDELEDLTRRCAAGDPDVLGEYEALNRLIEMRYRAMAKKKDAKPAGSPLVGRTIVDVRPMTAAELGAENWTSGRHRPPVVLVLDDGTKVYPSRDEEGNGPGCLFEFDPRRPEFFMVQ